MKKTLRAKQSFQAFTADGSVPVAEGALLPSDHPLVKGREHLFVEVDEYIENIGRAPKKDGKLMERATADPGEKRTVNPQPDPKPAAKPEEKPPVRRPVTKTKDGEV